MSKIAINTTNKEVISVSAKKAIPLAIKQATGASSGGGGNINITPYITMDGSSVVFNYFTPKQMEKVYIWLEGGNLRFELTKDEEGQYSLTTKSDIQELDGMFIVGGEEFIVNTIVDSFIVDLKGYKVSEVRIEGIDADLLDADFTWKLAEIRSGIGNIDEVLDGLNGVAQESTSQEILEEVQNIDIDTTELAKQGDNQEATNSAILDVLVGMMASMYKGVPVVHLYPKEGGFQRFTIQPNQYTIVHASLCNLVLNKGTDVDGIVNHYMVRLDESEKVFNTVTFGGFSLKWLGGVAPSLGVKGTLEISIINDLALYTKV